jgi:hypothetical protein
MGGSVLWLASSAQMTGGPGFQVAIGEGLERVFTRVESWVDPVPEPILGVAVLGLAAVLVVATLRGRGLTPEAERRRLVRRPMPRHRPTPSTAPRASHQH